MGLAYEDFEIGRTWVTPGRTVGEADISLFAGLSGDFSPIHVDEHVSRQGPFGGRIAHGPLPMSMAIGLMSQTKMFEHTVIGLLNMNWDFSGVVRIGDTIYAHIGIVEKRPTRRPDRGIVKVSLEVVNQHGTCVQRGVNTVMVLTRAGLAAPA